MANSTGGSSSAINYILDDKGEAKELDRKGVVGENGEEILAEMRFVQSLNDNCKKNTISMIISPNQTTGKEFAPAELRGILRQQLQNLGLTDHQYIATVHNSTKTPHIHVIVNRIDSKGKALDDSFLSKKAQTSAEKIAISLGLQTAKERGIERANGAKALIVPIQNAIEKYRPKNQGEFVECLTKSGMDVKAIMSKKNTGELNGYRINGFKASEISRSFSINNLDNTLKTINQKIQKDNGKAIEQPQVRDRPRGYSR